MKKTISVLLMGAFFMASCGILGTSSSTSSTSTTSSTSQQTALSTSINDGQAAGTALKSLYAQYQADGKFDYNNLNNIINTLQLVNSCQSLKSNAKDTNYWKEFASGLILGSDSLITEKIADKATEKLSSLSENLDTERIQDAKQDASAAAESLKSAASSISSILSLFKKN